MADDDTQPGEGEQPPPQYHPGEKGRTVPRSAWWVLALAVVLLLLLFIFRPTWFTRAPDDDSLHVPADRHFTKTLAGLGHGDGIRLTDDSPSTTFVGSVPVDSVRQQTRLKLTGSTQVAEDSTVFLIVSMDGQEVFQSELPRGDHDLDEKIAVPSGTAADGRVRVQVRTRGSLHTERCAPDHAAGMNIHLDPGTVVEAALDSPVHTVRDAVAAWDRRLTLVLAGQTDEWRTTAAQLGIALTRAGYSVGYTAALPESDLTSAVLLGPVDRLAQLGWTGDIASGPLIVGTVHDTPLATVVEPDATVIAPLLTGPAVATADNSGTDPRALATVPLSGNQVGAAALGADLSQAQITDSHTWRIAYSPTDLPGGRLPQAVRVAFSCRPRRAT